MKSERVTERAMEWVNERVSEEGVSELMMSSWNIALFTPLE